MPQKILARSQHYYRLALYGAAVLLTAAIIGAFCVITLDMVRRYEQGQLRLFVEDTQQIQIQAAILSGHLLRFTEQYEDSLATDSITSVSAEAQQQKDRNNNQRMRGTYPFETPFSIITSLHDASAFSMLDLLRVASMALTKPTSRTLSTEAMLAALVYNTDETFIAAYAPWPQQSGTPDSTNDLRAKIAAYESTPSGMSASKMKDQRPFWSASNTDRLAREAAVHIMFPIYLNENRIASVVYTICSSNFNRYFLGKNGISKLYVLDASGKNVLGSTEHILSAQPLLDVVKNDLAYPYVINGTVSIVRSPSEIYMIRRILGPRWIVIHIIDWKELLLALQKQLEIEVFVFGATLLAFWLAVLFFDRYIGSPMQRTASRLLEAERFNGSIVETLPVGIAIFEPSTESVLLENTVALRMLGNLGQDSRIAFYRKVVVERSAAHTSVNDGMASRSTHAFIETDWEINGARRTHIGVSLSETRFSGRDVLLFGLINMNEGKANEPLWRQAVANAEHPPPETISRALMSHEIRTPLHGAQGHLELLEETSLSIPQRERVVMIRRAFDNLKNVVDDILDVTKLHANALKINATLVQLNHVVERCAQNFAPIIQKKGIDFCCDTDALLDVEVQVDEQRVTQIIQNLLSNAAKFTEKGQIVISTRLIDHIDQRLWVRIEVTDSGIGIPAALQSSLFMPMVQADDTIARRFGGTGLGLFLCRNLASLMKGRVTLKSEPGKGSVFALELPVDTAPGRGTANHYPLKGRVVEVLCAMPRYKKSVINRIKAWGADVYQEHNRKCPSPDISLFVYLNEKGVPPKMISNTHHRIVVADPSGPLTPDHVGPLIRVSSLSSSALELALQTCFTDTDLVKPTDHARSTSYVEAALDLLVAEDEPLSRALICAQLARLGFKHVRVAEDGKEALRLWRDRPADVTFTDIGMPEIDGISLMREIHRYDPSAVVIATTAATAPITPSEFDQFFHVLRKPISLGDLGLALNSYATHVLLENDRFRRCENHTSAVSTLGTLSIDVDLMTIFEDVWHINRKNLADALSLQDIPGIQRGLHRLLGMLLTLGADSLADQCRLLESLCSEDAWERLHFDCVQLLQKIDLIVQDTENRENSQ